MELVESFYLLLKKLPKEERFGLRSQISRSAISMPSNIAEGYSRSSNKDRARFLEISIGSAFELETQLLIGQKVGFFNQSDVDKRLAKLHEFQKKTNALRNKIKLDIK